MKHEEALLQAVATPARFAGTPTASLQKLGTQLDAASAREPVSRVMDASRLTVWHVAMVAGAALLTGASLSTAIHTLRSPTSASHRTRSDAASPKAGISAVFANDLTVAGLQDLLDRSGLQIVAGPTASGVYTLVGTSRTRATTVALATLRADPQVRFAEPVDR